MHETVLVHDLLEDASLVDDLIVRAQRHPLGIDFLLHGELGCVAISLGAHAFTVEAARARLREQEICV